MPPPTSTSVPITAATGGTVELGSITLNILAGALDADTTITAETMSPSPSLPDQATIRSQVMVFGPDGTVFDPAAVLSLPMPSGLGLGQSAVLSYYDELANAWVDLETTVSGGSVSAPIEHFSRYVLRFVGGAAPVCDFTPCGGDPTGTWQLAGACVEADPFDGGCPSAEVAAAVTGTSGTIVFEGGGTITIDFDLTGTISTSIPASCYEPLSPSSCADVAAELDGATCSGSVGTSCDCSIPLNDSVTDSGTWSASGTSLIIETINSGEPRDNPICIDGDTLRLRTPDGTTYTFTRAS